jgi:peroxiredoxin (alkyl hydroperoxide reductase subunit C)
MCDNCNEMDMYDFDASLAPLSVGDSVPNFEFEVFKPAENGGKEELTKMSVEELAGKWFVFFFYPADFTFVCPTELEEMQAKYAEFQKEGVEIISVSTDTAFCHKAWHDSSPAIGKIEYPMAADANHMLSESFGVLIPDEGLALRGTFVINPEGEIVLAEINDNSIGRNANELLRKIKAAKFVASHDGQVCPASWVEGADTLEPGLDLVGKI